MFQVLHDVVRVFVSKAKTLKNLGQACAAFDYVYFIAICGRLAQGALWICAGLGVGVQGGECGCARLHCGVRISGESFTLYLVVLGGRGWGSGS